MLGAPNHYYSPLDPFWYQEKRLSNKYSFTEINRKFKKLYEAKLLGIIALSLFSKTKRPWYINLNPDNPNDSPDGYLFDKDNAKVLDVEVTEYYGRGSESLKDQLVRTNKIAKWSGSDHQALLVDVRTTNDYKPKNLNRYMRRQNIQFPVWCIKPLSHSPDTIAEIVSINPKLDSTIINVGASAHRWSNQRVVKYIQILPPLNKEMVGKSIISPNMERKEPLWETETEKILKRIGVLVFVCSIKCIMYGK